MASVAAEFAERHGLTPAEKQKLRAILDEKLQVVLLVPAAVGGGEGGVDRYLGEEAGHKTPMW